MKHLSIIILIFSIVFTACGPGKEVKERMDRARAALGTIPDAMPGSEKDTADLVALGNRLYQDKRLSMDNTVACATCHVLEGGKNGAEHEKTSTGVGGKLGGRNAPTVLNAGFHIAQFWDGRAKDLAEQAGGPILNPIEMAMPNEAAVIKKLKSIEEYGPLFAKAFPGPADPVSYRNLTEAIAAFERTLRTSDRFDDFLNSNAGALTAEEQQGLDLFMSTGCTACHNGPLIGGNSYQKMGAVNPYSNMDDFGREKITGKDEDKYFFKVPSLRNIALTAPYFHDGGAATLDEAVRLMAHLQLGKELKPEEVASIVTFLKTLSDKNRN